ncbi:MAG: penicillin-binding protein 2 [Flavobacteriales bacterium]|nr:penicillin-binding protein 2 [Flavobacteriales bacterium]MBK6944802.1 penicillin-binding protein 2 [Flavobacteriales bacterium]MBK7241048.1 penicillin-binding protein 2 [Flavobacteriales bacterium]MBK7295805.1 penicillin-binding protein 2 [Flavobacteriales bacterium]MBK9534459.1 penicillin-binding protein 2 [Flavobacteriales bacterium]
MNTESRKYVLIAGVLFISCVFILRLFWIQVVDGKWQAAAANMAERKMTVFPSRGLIFDRNEKLLVANTPVYDLMVVPKEVKPFDTLAFCAMIGVPVDDLRLRLAEATKYSKYKPSVMEKQIPADQFAAISVHLHKYPGFYGQSRTLRTYPPHAAAHLLGYLSEVNARKVEEDPYYKSGDVIGVGGLESFYEPSLRGKRGVSYVLMDVHNNMKGSFKGGAYDTLAVEGSDLYTGIDLDMQLLGEKLMVNKKGSIVALDPKTGEVLCLVSSPSYDPELLVGRVRNTNYGVLQRDPIKPLFDRALQAQYPPGSIFKIAQALIALDEGVITTETGFPCNKSLVGCHNHPSAGDIRQAIQMSCNPYFHQVFKRIVERGENPNNRFKDAALGLAEWEKRMRSFGLGSRPAIDLPSVKGGNIPGPAYYDRKYGEARWAFSTIYSVSIGQGEVLVAPLQMANLAAIFANKGWYYDPHVVRAIGDPDSVQTQYRDKHYVDVHAQWFDHIQEGMRRVVNEAGGTARRARIDGITVCGKTGTAENPHGQDHAVFIAFAPMEDPKIAIAVYVENSGFGGTWAAPIASLLMEQYLTDTITRPEVVKKMEEADLISKEATYVKKPKRK